MKRLKIEDKKASYSVGAKTYAPIDQVTKEDLLGLLDAAIEEDNFEMDAFAEDSIQNPAHRIIYKNIHDKIADLRNNRLQFRNEANQLYKEAFEKYKVESTSADSAERTHLMLQ
jgi:hypothetical protein